MLLIKFPPANQLCSARQQKDYGPLAPSANQKTVFSRFKFTAKLVPPHFFTSSVYDILIIHFTSYIFHFLDTDLRISIFGSPDFDNFFFFLTLFIQKTLFLIYVLLYSIGFYFPTLFRRGAKRYGSNFINLTLGGPNSLGGPPKGAERPNLEKLKKPHRKRWSQPTLKISAFQLVQKVCKIQGELIRLLRGFQSKNPPKSRISSHGF